MSHPVVSVIIPVYNTEKYLNACLQSVASQSAKNFEVICINDGSTDNSAKILSNWQELDKRFNIITQSNQGQSRARNTGLKIAKGKYIYFLDSDDSILPEALNLLIQVAEKDNIQVVYFDGETEYEDESLRQKFPGFATAYSRKNNYIGVVSGAELANNMLDTNEYSCSPCLQFIDREFLKCSNISFHPNILHEDNLFSFMVFANAKRVVHINKKLFVRRVRTDSTMTKPTTAKNFFGYASCLHEINKHIDLTSVNDTVARYAQRIISLLIDNCLTLIKNQEILKQAKVELESVTPISLKLHLHTLLKTIEASSKIISVQSAIEGKVDIPATGHIDVIKINETEVVVTGWLLAYSRIKIDSILLCDGQYTTLPSTFTSIERPDVLALYNDADLDCGFTAAFPLKSTFKPDSIALRGEVGKRLITEPIFR